MTEGKLTRLLMFILANLPCRGKFARFDFRSLVVEYGAYSAGEGVRFSKAESFCGRRLLFQVATPSTSKLHFLLDAEDECAGILHAPLDEWYGEFCRQGDGRALRMYVDAGVAWGDPHWPWMLRMPSTLKVPVAAGSNLPSTCEGRKVMVRGTCQRSRGRSCACWSRARCFDSLHWWRQ